MLIESIEQYIALRHHLEPVVVQGKNHKIAIPCANTLVVKRALVLANTYNPNSVPDDKMELLSQSIIDNGFAFPVVTIYDPDQQAFVIIDGFHRFMIAGYDYLGLSHIPIVVLEHNASKRMVATIQFNKARGVHQVDLDADVIRGLINQGMSEDDISIHLGLDIETIHRYKQLTGIADLFKNAQYSMSWSIVEVEDAA
jgi:ParB-like chromosome segregation protein Spo0J